MSATQQRDEACRIAPADAARALRIARQISDPWFRCQALASASIFVQANLRRQVIDEAFFAANKLEEINRVVTVSSWPLKALAMLGDFTLVQSEGTRLLATISNEPSPVRRADAFAFSSVRPQHLPFPSRSASRHLSEARACSL
jgi:hypothetical protein